MSHIPSSYFKWILVFTTKRLILQWTLEIIVDSLRTVVLEHAHQWLILKVIKVPPLLRT